MRSCGGGRAKLRLLAGGAAVLSLSCTVLLILELQEQAGTLAQVRRELAALKGSRLEPHLPRRQSGAVKAIARGLPGGRAPVRRLETFAHVSAAENATASSGCVTVSLYANALAINMSAAACGSSKCPPCFIIRQAPEPAFVAERTLTVIECSTMNLGMNMRFQDVGPFSNAAATYRFTNSDPSHKAVVMDGTGARTVLEPGSSRSAVCWTTGALNGVVDHLHFTRSGAASSSADVHAAQLYQPVISYGGAADKYHTVVADKEGTLFAAPATADKVLWIDPFSSMSGTFSYASTYGKAISGPKYSAMVLSVATGKLYAAPNNARYVLEIDTAMQSCSELLNDLGSTTGKYLSMAVANNGNIYAAPYNAEYALVINLQDTPTAATIGDYSAVYAKYRTTVAASDGKVYAAPWMATNALEIDPVMGTTTLIGVAFSGSEKYYAMVAAPNERLYAAPYSAPKVLEIDPASPTSKCVLLPENYEGQTEKYKGVALASNGKIYAVPATADRVLEIYPVNGSSRLLPESYGVSNSKYEAVVAAPNGKLYAAPSDEASVLEIDPASASSMAVGTLPGTAAGKYVAMAAAANGKLVAAPSSEAYILVVSPSIR